MIFLFIEVNYFPVQIDNKKTMPTIHTHAGISPKTLLELATEKYSHFLHQQAWTVCLG
jgi:hypothetical protein